MSIWAALHPPSDAESHRALADRTEGPLCVGVGIIIEREARQLSLNPDDLIKAALAIAS